MNSCSEVVFEDQLRSDQNVADTVMHNCSSIFRRENIVRQLPIDRIDPSPYQIRRIFDSEETHKLVQSILENGLLQPITVQRGSRGRFVLIAGERRLRACKQIGYITVPAIVCRTDKESGALLGYIENCDRSDLDFFDRAYGLQLLQSLWGCSQEKAAFRIGLSQAAFCNKLRLLQLSQEEQNICRTYKLSERHARAVLSLSASDKRMELLSKAGIHQWSVSYLEQQVKLAQMNRTLAHRKFMTNDVRLFLNTVNKAIETMILAGVHVVTSKQEEDEYIEYRVRIPLSEIYSHKG